MKLIYVTVTSILTALITGCGPLSTVHHITLDHKITIELKEIEVNINHRHRFDDEIAPEKRDILAERAAEDILSLNEPKHEETKD